ncbi:MAG: UDP-glucose/GDP-mannose dehydrogenase family protein [Puniceicoccales bacterium]|nr:UDP-glucose/GDP-mannose dehydrogenase family protein [Puniceicoccales bacterium]
MKIGIIGTGYVGFSTGVGFAELGHSVICVDSNTKKIEHIKNGNMPIFEDGMEDIFKRNLDAKKIRFSTSMKDGVTDADVVIISVGTPTDPQTRTIDLSYVRQSATELAGFLGNYTVIVLKSTVEVGTCDEIEGIISRENPTAEFDVVSIPEFLREGFAVHDFFNPDRIVIGTDSTRAQKVIEELYKPLLGKFPIVRVSRRSSEMIKYASNAFLAIKVHYINEIANLCEQTGASIDEVRLGVGMDSRIGDKFLNPGPGYGGSCFPKDTSAMVSMGLKNGVRLSLVECAIAGNEKRKTDMASRILDDIKGIVNPKMAILGLAFKGGTDDCRESPAVEIIENVLKKSEIEIVAYDPRAMANAENLLGNRIKYARSAYAAAEETHLLVIATEWDEFKDLDLKKIKSTMVRPKIFDMRNVIDIREAKKIGFVCSSIGRRT